MPDTSLTLFILIIILSIGFGVVNGFNDAANAIAPEKLPPYLKNVGSDAATTAGIARIGDEQERIKSVLEQVHWNRSKAAQLLGIGRATLWRKMKAYKLLD